MQIRGSFGEKMFVTMSKRFIIGFLLIVAFTTSFCETSCFAALSQHSTNTSLRVGDPSEIVVGLDETQPQAYENLLSFINQFDGRIVNNIAINGKTTALVVEIPSSSSSTFMNKAEESGFAKYVEPNVKFKAQLDPNDTFYIDQWSLKTIQANWAWNTTTGSPSVLVAVIDTGIDYTHPDLAANYVSGGYDWVNSDNDPMDDNGHGTHCAGIIAAVMNNNLGVAGLAQVGIMAEKGLDYEGYGYEDELAGAIIHAVDHGAKILSLSWGGDTDSYLIHDAISYAYYNDVLVVAAAGNNGTTMKMYPAAYKEVVAVTATDSDDKLAVFSSYGDWVDVAAPGVQIYSTFPNSSYAHKSGTSMACPHVAGVAALVWSQFPSATRNWVRAQLRYTADDLGSEGFDIYYGYGRINARRAVEQAPQEHDLVVFDLEKPRYIQPSSAVNLDVTVLNFGTTTEHDLEVQLFIDENRTDSTTIYTLVAGSLKTVSFTWTPLNEGRFNVTLYVVPVAGETSTQNNVMTQMVQVRRIVSPPQGPVGTKVTVYGTSFLPATYVEITFNDMLIGYGLVNNLGVLSFTFNVPFSSAGQQTIKITEADGNYETSPFTVIDTTALDVKIDVGTLYFMGETGAFYAQTVFEGQAVDATIPNATLITPNGTTQSLTAQQVATGLYKIPYTITGNETGTYTLVLEANYTTNTIQAYGTSFKCFLVSDTLALMSGQVTETKDGVATIQTEMGLVQLNLTAMNATLENIFVNVLAINGTTATIQTTLGTMNGTITAINGNVATILVPDIGEIKADVSTLRQIQETPILQYLTLAVAVIAAISATICAILLKRKPKPPAETGP